MVKIELSSGDLFSIPVNSSFDALGQIVAIRDAEIYIAVYEEKYPVGSINPNEVCLDNILILTLSLDAKFYHGDWKILGNKQSNLVDIPDTYYKVQSGDVCFVESRDRAFVRPASSGENNFLRFRTVFSPAVVEKAVKALAGFGPWLPGYEDLRASYAYDCQKLLKKSF